MTKPELDLATTRRPWGSIPLASGQWPEARNFSRTYGLNPFRQIALVDTLISLHETARNYPHSDTLPESSAEIGLPVPSSDLATAGIARTLWYVGNEEPQWQSKRLDTWDSGVHTDEGRYYSVNRSMLAEYKAVLAGEQIANSEHRAASFLRVHERNPHATANLMQTLVGMYKKPWEGWCESKTTASLPIHEKDTSLQLSRRGIAQALWYLATAFPDWASDAYQPTPTMETFDGFPPYACEGRLHNFVRWVPNEEPDLAMPIERSMITFG